MKIAALIAGVLLGLLFVFSAAVVFLGLAPSPEFPEGSPIASFMAAFGPTGYMTFIKIFELLGGIAVAIPKTRNLGLLLLGPVIVNIFAFHVFVAKGGYFESMLLVIAALALFLLWVERKAWLNLLFPSKS